MGKRSGWILAAAATVALVAAQAAHGTSTSDRAARGKHASLGFGASETSQVAVKKRPVPWMGLARPLRQGDRSLEVPGARESSIPEPSAALLFGGAALVVGWTARRRKSV